MTIILFVKCKSGKSHCKTAGCMPQAFDYTVFMRYSNATPKYMGFQDSSLNISKSRLVILAASICEISCGKKSDTQTNGGKNRTPVTAVGVVNYCFTPLFLSVSLLCLLPGLLLTGVRAYYTLENLAKTPKIRWPGVRVRTK